MSNEGKKEEDSEGSRNRERVTVKGYMRQGGTSFYVAIPKEIRELLELKG